MTSPFGTTRTYVGARHAVFSPDGHVKSTLPGVSGAAAIVLIDESIGARFAQLLLTFEARGRADFDGSERETAGFIETGACTLRIGDDQQKAPAGTYFFAPAGESWSLTNPVRNTRVTLFQKRYVSLANTPAPGHVIGSAADVPGEPFLGDPDARLQVLLPDAPGFDLAMNLFTYQPGATLPFVETHVMEHGLLMLRGQGIYRLEDNWYPVKAGDAIWMAPYCRQWFAAMGKQPATYLYYKDVNRAPLT